MPFELVPEDFQGFKPVHKRVVVGTTSSLPTVIATGATGKILIPIQYRYIGSAGGTVTFTAGSGGASMFSGLVVANSGENWGPWWDVAGAGENTNIEVVAAAGIGNFTAELWYIVVPGSSGLTQ